jgi:dTDP-4-dehydrorhamnose reductase
VLKILLTGRQGQVGWELEQRLKGLGEIVAFDKTTLDLSQAEQIRDTVSQVQPKLIINTAAYTAVDKAESEQELAEAVNAIAPGILAQAAKDHDAAMIHYSTDYVFDGKKSTAYDEDDLCNPLSVYGKTKWQGEQNILATGIPCLILRTSGVYGTRGKNFLKTILRLANEKEEIRIVNDQIGAPTWCGTLAHKTTEILQWLIDRSSVGEIIIPRELSGIYHLTCGGQTSWHGFAEAILQYSALAKTPKLIPIPTEEYPTPAKRPLSSLLSNQKLERAMGIRQTHWEVALKSCLEQSPGG